MSEENVEIVRAALEAISRGDLDAAAKNLAPDAEYDLSRALGPFQGVYRGPNEIRRVGEEFAEPWESQRYEVEEFIEAGEHVITPFTNHLLGRDGIAIQARAAFLWTVREGSIVYLGFYQQKHEALEA